MKPKELMQWTLAGVFSIVAAVVWVYGLSPQSARAGEGSSSPLANVELQPCGSGLYDPATQGCCNGQVYDLATQACCGGQVYDLATQCCCEVFGVIYNKNSEGSCCDQWFSQ